MNGREDQIILIAQGNARFGAGGVGRVERQLGQKLFARRIGRRDLFQLQEIELSRDGVLVQAL